MAEVAHFGARAILFDDLARHCGYVEGAKLRVAKVPIIISILVSIVSYVLARVPRAAVIAKPHIEAFLEEQDREGRAICVCE